MSEEVGAVLQNGIEWQRENQDCYGDRESFSQMSCCDHCLKKCELRVLLMENDLQVLTLTPPCDPSTSVPLLSKRSTASSS